MLIICYFLKNKLFNFLLFCRNGQGYLFAGQKDDMPFDDIPELVKFLIRSKALGTPVLPDALHLIK